MPLSVWKLYKASEIGQLNTRNTMPFSLRSFLKPASYNTPISRTDRLLAQIFSYTTLLGYILLPSFFPQLSTTTSHTSCIQYSEHWDCPDISNNPTPPPPTIQIPSPFYLCALACCTGHLGSLYLWQKYQRHVQWLINWVFFPAFVNSLAGIGMGVGKAVGAPEEQYSAVLKVAMVVPSALSAVAAVLALWYYGGMFRAAKRKEDVDVGGLEKEKGRDEES